MPTSIQTKHSRRLTDARKNLFGTDRILDASQKTRRDFLTSMGLDFGVKVRCYVEGSTEMGALGSALDGISGIEFINLRGQVIESKGKGLSFIHSLENDINSKIFSVVMIDADRQDYVRALKRAAENEKIFGMFFISSPDVEFENFSIDELIEVALRLVANEDGGLPTRDELLSKVTGSNSASEFLKRASAALGRNIQKGEAWGEALMNYALENPTGTNNSEDATAERQLVRAARAIYNGTKSGYDRSYVKSKVDPNTGELVEK